MFPSPAQTSLVPRSSPRPPTCTIRRVWEWDYAQRWAACAGSHHRESLMDELAVVKTHVPEYHYKLGECETLWGKRWHFGLPLSVRCALVRARLLSGQSDDCSWSLRLQQKLHQVLPFFFCLAAGSLVSALGFCTASAVKSFLTLTTSFGCPLNLTSHGTSCSAGDCAVDGGTQKQRTGSRNLPWNMADNSTPLDYCYSIFNKAQPVLYIILE